MNIIMSKTDSSLLVCNSPSFLCGKLIACPVTYRAVRVNSLLTIVRGGALCLRLQHSCVNLCVNCK